MLGRESKKFIWTETAAGTFQKPVATNAVKLRKLEIDYQKRRSDRTDSRQTRSLQERITGKTEVNWSLEGDWIPSGTANQAPDLRALILNMMGVKTFTAALTVIDYTKASGKTLTVEVDGTVTTLTEGVDFIVGASNNATATAIEVAVEAVSGVESSATDNAVTATSTTATRRFIIGGGTGQTGGAWTATSSGLLYSLTATQGALGTIGLCDHAGPGMITAVGGYCEEIEWMISGGDPLKVSASGRARDAYFTGYSALTTSPSGIDNFSVTAGEGVNYEANSVVQIGTQTNAGAGWKVSSVSTDALTIEAVITESSGAIIKPYTPTETTSGSPVSGTLGSITIDSVAVPITAAKIKLKQNYKPIDDEAFAAGLSDQIEGWRSVTGEITVRARADQLKHFGHRKQSFTNRGVIITCGNTGGARTIFTLISVEMEFSPLQGPEAEEYTFTLPFVAVSTSGEQEFEINFT